MQLRIYKRTGITSSSPEQIVESIRQKLGIAQDSDGKASIFAPGIVTKPLVEKILSQQIQSASGSSSNRYQLLLEDAEQEFVQAKGWVLSNYVNSKFEHRKNIVGVLYNVEGTGKYGKDLIPHYFAMAIGVKPDRDVLFLASLGGRTSRYDFDKISEAIAQTVSPGRKLFQFGLSEDDLKELARSCYRDRNCTVYYSNVDIDDIVASFKHRENLFQSRGFDQIDSEIQLERRIMNGDWNALGFLVDNPPYSVIFTKIYGKISVYSNTALNAMLKRHTIDMFDDLFRRIDAIRRIE